MCHLVRYTYESKKTKVLNHYHSLFYWKTFCKILEIHSDRRIDYDFSIQFNRNFNNIFYIKLIH